MQPRQRLFYRLYHLHGLLIPIPIFIPRYEACTYAANDFMLIYFTLTDNVVQIVPTGRDLFHVTVNLSEVNIRPQQQAHR